MFFLIKANFSVKSSSLSPKILWAVVTSDGLRPGLCDVDREEVDACGFIRVCGWWVDDDDAEGEKEEGDICNGGSGW